MEKKINVFLASSEELADERIRFGNFIRKIDDLYEERGYRIKLIMWEDLPSGDDGRPKQEEYNEKVRECEMFVGLFHTKAGPYTLEEYDTAKKSQASFGKPTLYVFCRELAEGECEEPSLKDFKSKLLNDIRHYWNKYINSDSLQLQFTLQLLKVENSHWNDLKVENGSIQLAGMKIAHMDNLSFAIGNKGYQEMKDELQDLPEEIETLRTMVKEHPKDLKYQNQLQKKLNRYNALQEEFSSHQQNLFATAKRIAKMQLDTISSELSRVIDEFKNGHVEAANAILCWIESEGDRHIKQLNIDRTLVHKDIEALQLKTKTIMADVTIPVKQRVSIVLATYEKIDDWAEKSALEKEDYSKLLYEYGMFLYDYSMYDQALKIWKRECQMNEDLFGLMNMETAKSYNAIGYVYYRLEKYSLALEYHEKSLTIRQKLLGADHINTATSYSNIGLVLYDQRNYNEALDFLEKALNIRKNVLGITHPNTATSYYNIGKVYFSQGEYTLALESFKKALDVRIKTFGLMHTDVAKAYNKIGKVLYLQGNYDQALEYYMKAFAIFENRVGIEHAYTAKTYENIGEAYCGQRKFDLAMDNYQKALIIFENVLPKEHSAIHNIRELINGLNPGVC